MLKPAHKHFGAYTISWLLYRCFIPQHMCYVIKMLVNSVSMWPSMIRNTLNVSQPTTMCEEKHWVLWIVPKSGIMFVTFRVQTALELFPSVFRNANSTLFLDTICFSHKTICICAILIPNTVLDIDFDYPPANTIHERLPPHRPRYTGLGG